jgi:hypothetical protein
VPRFYFHTNHPAERCVQDDVAMVYPSIERAKGEAVAYAGRLLCDAAEHFWDYADFELTVTDAKGLILLSLRISGTVAPAIRAHPRQAT